MEEHPYFLERVASYRNPKGDPGDAFMQEVRRRLSDHGLQGS